VGESREIFSIWAVSTTISVGESREIFSLWAVSTKISVGESREIFSLWAQTPIYTGAGNNYHMK
jgi:hypothetical protein